MKKHFLVATAVALAAVALSGTAAAQQYKWVDKDGKVQYGDVPPAGAKPKNLNGTPVPAAPSARGAPAPAPAPAAAAKGAAKDAGKGPLTPAELEADYRKRQIEAEKSREKEDKLAQEAQGRRDNCASTQEALRALESGQRIPGTDANGERYFLDDDQRAAQLAKARKAVGDWCR